MIEMSVQRVGIDQSRRTLVILADAEGRRLLPIWIGPYEAQSIAMALRREAFERPLTHDLALAIIERLGYELQRVDVTRLEDHTFYGLLGLVRGDELLQIDSRPSDAIALALRAEAKIFVAEEVLEQAQIIDDGGEQEQVDIDKFRDLLHEAQLDSEHQDENPQDPDE
jgi:bifunctional DNase/RNase